MKRNIFIVMLLLFIPSVVFPHAYLMTTEPPEDAILTESPEKVTMNFLGTLEHVFSKIEVLDKDGNKVSGKIEFTNTDDGTSMHVGFQNKLKNGEYIVKWICMGIDGHKQKGSFKFTLK
jgi:methionine-rich copper-binding protein CopC